MISRRLARLLFPLSVLGLALLPLGPSAGRLVGAAEAQQSLPAGLATYEMQGRQFDLYSPASLGSARAPLVLLLHGGLGNAERTQDDVPLFDQAEANGFRVAYLNGTLLGRGRADMRTWNAGFCCGSSADQGVDDVGYLASVISSFIAQGLADSRQIYLVGHSNGAMMTYRFACERPDLVRGIVPISGALVAQGCPNASGVKVLHIHGARDRLVPVAGGGNQRLSNQPFPPLQDTLDRVRAAGAAVDVILLESATHRVRDVAGALQQEQGITLPQLIAQFVRAG